MNCYIDKIMIFNDKKKKKKVIKLNKKINFIIGDSSEGKTEILNIIRHVLTNHDHLNEEMSKNITHAGVTLQLENSKISYIKGRENERRYYFLNQEIDAFYENFSGFEKDLKSISSEVFFSEINRNIFKYEKDKNSDLNNYISPHNIFKLSYHSSRELLDPSSIFNRGNINTYEIPKILNWVFSINDEKIMKLEEESINLKKKIDDHNSKKIYIDKYKQIKNDLAQILKIKYNLIEDDILENMDVDKFDEDLNLKFDNLRIDKKKLKKLSLEKEAVLYNMNQISELKQLKISYSSVNNWFENNVKNGCINVSDNTKNQILDFLSTEKKIEDLYVDLKEEKNKEKELLNTKLVFIKANISSLKKEILIKEEELESMEEGVKLYVTKKINELKELESKLSSYDLEFNLDDIKQQLKELNKNKNELLNYNRNTVENVINKQIIEYWDILKIKDDKKENKLLELDLKTPSIVKLTKVDDTYERTYLDKTGSNTKYVTAKISILLAMFDYLYQNTSKAYNFLLLDHPSSSVNGVEKNDFLKNLHNAYSNTVGYQLIITEQTAPKDYLLVSQKEKEVIHSGTLIPHDWL